MTVLITIITSVVFALIVGTIMIRFRKEETSKIAVVLGSVGTGTALAVLNNYLIPNSPKLSWLYLLVLGAFMAALVYQWYKQGSDLLEFLAFSALTLIVGGIAKAAAANYHSTFLSLLIAWVVILAIGFYGFTALKFHRKRSTLKEGERKNLLKQKKDDTVEAMDKKVAKFTRQMALVAAITIIALAGATGLILGMASNSTPKNEPAQTQASVIGGTADAADDLATETKDILIQWTEHDLNRIDSKFKEKLEAEAGDGEITPEVVKTVILKDCEDPEQLAFWSWMFGLRDTKDDYEALMIKEGEEEKLSDEGRDLYNQLKGYLQAKEAVLMEREEAPVEGINTGYSDGFVVAEVAGIDGDRSGTKVTLPDGEVFWIMDRCGNVVFKGNPPKSIPKGPTDNPTPEKRNYKDQSKRKAIGNDNKGPGEKTIGDDPNHSTKDRKDNSTSGSYQDYKDNQKNLEDTNKSQKTGSDSNTPSTAPPKSDTNVDNSGDKGNGGDPINKPTSKKEAETTKNDPAADHMDEPS